MVPGIFPAQPRVTTATTDVHDSLDEPGAELGREARVWKMYVREADKWDKEMVDGKTNSLDVLLIFAALFSAISTAFVIESLGDLKPDPAESSAQTLLIVAQTLTAIASNTSVTPPPINGLDAPSFSPSRTAVQVNILWFLSLSLSVAVSLVTMLAKGWCYKFMSNRTGPAYDQARRRQERWNGMEKWKMMSVLTYLPGVMHVALRVTLLPHALDPFCPYSTPAGTVFTDVKMAFIAMIRTAVKTIVFAKPKVKRALLVETLDIDSGSITWRISSTVFWFISSFFTLLACVMPTMATLHIPKTVWQLIPGYSGDDTTVPMDAVTSQMVSWLIANCEDPYSVDTALQAIAGADGDLPYEPLGDCGTLKLMLPRLDACLKRGDYSPVALRYYRSYGIIISGLFGGPFDRWGRSPYIAIDNDTAIWRHLKFQLDHTNLIERTEGLPDDPNLLASVLTTAIPFCHWTRGYTLEGPRLNKALETMTSLINRQLQPNGDVLYAPVLYALVRSTAHYLIGVWPREERSTSNSLLPLSLVYTFMSCYDAAPDTACAAAITLACTAFASRPHPGSMGPTQDLDAQESRAVEVLRYYQAHKPDKDTTVALFLFGFSGLLPHLDFSEPGTRLAIMPGCFNEVVRRAPEFEFSDYRTNIHTLFPNYSLEKSVYMPALESLTLVANGQPHDDELGVVLACLPLLFCRDAELYVLALTALCRAHTRELQDLCINIVDVQPLPSDMLAKPIRYNDNKILTLLEQLCRTLTDANTTVPPIAILHFELLIASIVSAVGYSPRARGNALVPLLGFRNEVAGLKDPSPVGTDRVFSHLQQDLTQRNVMLHAMQLIVDFCYAGLDQGDTPINWRDRLVKLKESYKPGTAMIPRLGEPEPGSSSHGQEAAGSSGAGAAQVGT